MSLMGLDIGTTGTKAVIFGDEGEGRDVYDVLMERMADEPTDIFLLPHFAMAGTPYMDPGAIGGIIGLRLTTTRQQLIRAVVEGITYEMKLSLELLNEAGMPVEELRAIGGGAKSDRWLQLKADETFMPDENRASICDAKMSRYKKLYPLFRGFREES